MYESHFGFSAAPFQLNPDPAFYFESRGHSNALSYLRFGVYQGEGFIVVTGDIGAGKTTLVRTMLEGLDSGSVVAAQVVSTQLESDDLLRAILVAFGLSADGTSKAQLIATLEAFLTSVAASGKRALLVIDEAQNLGPRAVEELRMLSNFQLGTHGLLQSFLVGQPELRALLKSQSMEQLRQRVIASCHLGPLDAPETRKYIEHRLMKVGWSDNPRFDDEAFSQIFTECGGVPRRINRLCNRLLLAAFLGGHSNISAELVRQTSGELREEIGEAADESIGTNRGANSPAIASYVHDRSDIFLCVASGSEEVARAADFVRSVAGDEGIAQSIRLVNMSVRENLNAADSSEIRISLGRCDTWNEFRSSLDAMASLIESKKPRGILIVGVQEAMLGCALAATRLGVPVARLASKLEAVSANTPILQTLCADLSSWTQTISPGAPDASEFNAARRWLLAGPNATTPESPPPQIKKVH